MALYEVHHPLSLVYKDGRNLINQIAVAITSAHLELFDVPAMFVTVRFLPEEILTDTPTGLVKDFVGGQVRIGDFGASRITAYLPTSNFYSEGDYYALCSSIKRAWNNTVNKDLQKRKFKDLRSIHIVKTAAVMDMDIMGPSAEEGSGAWLKKSMPSIEDGARSQERSRQKYSTEFKNVIKECNDVPHLRRLLEDSTAPALPPYSR